MRFSRSGSPHRSLWTVPSAMLQKKMLHDCSKAPWMSSSPLSPVYQSRRIWGLPSLRRGSSRVPSQRAVSRRRVGVGAAERQLVAIRRDVGDRLERRGRRIEAAHRQVEEAALLLERRRSRMRGCRSRTPGGRSPGGCTSPAPRTCRRRARPPPPCTASLNRGTSSPSRAGPLLLVLLDLVGERHAVVHGLLDDLLQLLVEGEPDRSSPVRGAVSGRSSIMVPARSTRNSRVPGSPWRYSS
jgi:hypothetical protein